jgi:hypothetical protein
VRCVRRMWDGARKSRRYRNREMIEAECDPIAVAAAKQSAARKSALDFFII